MPNKMQHWKTLSRTSVLSFGKWLTVERHVVELPDGRIIQDWPWVITPDFASIAAFTPEGRLVCFRQVKYAVEGESLAEGLRLSPWKPEGNTKPRSPSCC